MITMTATREDVFALHCPEGYKFGVQLDDAKDSHEACYRASQILWPRVPASRLYAIRGTYKLACHYRGGPPPERTADGFIVYRPI